MEEWQQILVAYLGLAAAAGVAAAGLWAWRWPSRLLPLQRSPRGAWSGREVVLCLLFIILAEGLAVWVVQGIGFAEKLYGPDPPPKKQAFWAVLLARPLGLVLIFSGLYAASRTRPAHLGWTWSRWPANVVLGMLAWLVLTPVVYLVNFVAEQLVSPRPHLFTEAAKEFELPGEWVALFVQTIVFAPALEETLFRGVLQGWLRRAGRRGHFVLAGLTLLLAVALGLKTGEGDQVWFEPEAAVFVLLLLVPYAALVWRVAMPVTPPDSPAAETGDDTRPPDAASQRPPPLPGEQRSVWPAVYGTSLAFALSHAAAWPSPIPLFALSLGLGWLAYRSQSLVAPALVHGLFNAVTCVALALQAWGR